jgi:hypothetical protein
MDTFQLCKLATDVALILSVLYLSARFIRSHQSSVDTRELRDLEIVLKNLLKDADVASRALSESLTRRQQSLERVLSELDGGERRVATAVRSAEEISARLNRTMADSRAIQPQSNEGVTSADSQEYRSPPTPSPRKPAPSRRSEVPLSQQIEVASEDAEWVEPPSFEENGSRMGRGAAPVVRRPLPSAAPDDLEQPRRTGAAAYRSVASRPAPSETETRSQSSSSNPQYNVFGERMEMQRSPESSSSSRREQLPRQPLADEVEVERLAPPRAANPTPRPNRQRERADIQDIYESAERLLIAGEDIETVAAATRLPLDEVRRLSQIVVGLENVQSLSHEKSAETMSAAPAGTSSAPVDPTTDPRLGVFASMRRQTQVL